MCRHAGKLTCRFPFNHSGTVQLHPPGRLSTAVAASLDWALFARCNYPCCSHKLHKFCEVRKRLPWRKEMLLRRNLSRFGLSHVAQVQPASDFALAANCRFDGPYRSIGWQSSMTGWAIKSSNRHGKTTLSFKTSLGLTPSVCRNM